MTTDLDSAVKHLKRAVELYPSFVEAHHNLGNAFIMGAEYNQVVYDMLHKARDLDALRYIEEAYSDALDALEKAVSLKHQFPEAHNNRGKALIGLERYEEALQAFDIAIEQSPGYTKAIENREILRTRLKP